MSGIVCAEPDKPRPGVGPRPTAAAIAPALGTAGEDPGRCGASPSGRPGPPTADL